MRRLALLLAVAGALVCAGPAAAATHYTGTLRDGATWIADVPADWNGTLLLYSHGYGPLNAADAPNPATQQALLDQGYALAGSSYDPHGSWWALGSAVRDQFQTLTAVRRNVLPARPRKVYAVGTSMGGLVSALEDQRSRGRLNGALTTCGIVGGANNLNQYQLDGEYAISELLAPGQHIQLTGFTVGPPTFADSTASADKLTAAAHAAQSTAAGRARLALALAYLNVSPWGGASMPGVYDYAAQEQGQYDDYFVATGSVLDFIVTGRQQIELAAGGEGSGTVGVNFARALHRSSYYNEVRALYEEAGLSLKSDLARLARHADLKPDRAAYRRLARTSVPSGNLQVPELDLHTISDQLVPVQHERWYHARVALAGDKKLLRQAYVERQGHCNFTPGEIVAGLHALEHRVNTGGWDDATTAAALNAAGGSGSAFLPFWPDRLTGGISPRLG
jgi:hypothetical protein